MASPMKGDDPNEMKDGRYNINTGEFSDIWDTDTDSDKSRVWGTDEYFRRIENSRDEWNTGLEDYPGMTHRIKRQIDLDAQKIKEDAKEFSRKIKIDAQKMQENARKAAETVRNRVAQQTVTTRAQAQKKLFEDINTNSIRHPKKPKRRFKLSAKSGGIGIFGLIFWSVLLFNMCGDKEEKTAKVIDTSSKVTASEVFEKAREYSNTAITKVEETLKEVDKQVKEKKKPSDNNDPYNQPEDRYGGTEDKW